MRVRLRSTYVAREQVPGYVIHGMKGSFIKAKTNVQEDALNLDKLPVGDDWGQEDESEWGLLHAEKDGEIIREIIPSLKGQYLDYYEGIYQALRNKAALPVPAEEGLNVIRIIEAAYESSRTKKIVDL
jgi:predicted dehydrogenase